MTAGIDKRLGRRAFMGIAAGGLTSLLAGCFGPRPLVTYDLTLAGNGPVRRRSTRMVVITEPDAVQTYATDRMVVRQPGDILSYLPDAQWSDSLTNLIQTRMIQAFEDSDVSNVGRPSDQLAFEVVLATDVRAFDIDVTAGQQAVVTLAARLIDDIDRRIIANRSFTASAPIAELDGVNAARAFDVALNDVVRQIIAWTAINA
ncbi:ABC-type transport auxiliary lipoprotein family protein [Devosia nitrariae]|uniref:ABC transporter n=1 Tax=Devosia nitrariae TaxID=2071872 RepID=A0ABQ5WEB0_9HYPH|nr:ABC-type transport auxiliary lipoprotein family protein [Devosia nitrariae]GLQ58121.1 ABC transporter [Devosia nitrariae]